VERFGVAMASANVALRRSHSLGRPSCHRPLANRRSLGSVHSLVDPASDASKLGRPILRGKVQPGRPCDRPASHAVCVGSRPANDHRPGRSCMPPSDRVPHKAPAKKTLGQGPPAPRPLLHVPCSTSLAPRPLLHPLCLLGTSRVLKLAASFEIIATRNKRSENALLGSYRTRTQCNGTRTRTR